MDALQASNRRRWKRRALVGEAFIAANIGAWAIGLYRPWVLLLILALSAVFDRYVEKEMRR